MNKNIIIAIIIVILIAVVGVFIFSQPTDGKINTQINFLSESTLKNGEQVQFELKDAQGAVIAGQNINISYDDGSGYIQKYSVTTDQNGQGFLTISGENAGNYNITLDYGGNDKYNGCSAKQTITIETDGYEDTSTVDSVANETTTAAPTNSSASTSSYNSNSTDSQQSDLNYDSQYNFYYDDNGIIRGGQSDGMSAKELRSSYESGDMVDAEGNLQ